MSRDTNHNKDASSLLQFICKARNLYFDSETETITAAIAERMQSLQIADYDQYKDYLQVHPQEFDHLLARCFKPNEVLLVDQVWNDLKKGLLAKVTQRPGANLRVWVVGVSDGREAYGCAMAWAELIGMPAKVNQMKIFVTDTDEERITSARQGVYNKDLLISQLPPELITKYFSCNDSKCTFRPDLRRSIIFGKHNVATDPAILGMDLILCRGVLAYYNSETQIQITRNLLRALNEQGILLLGRNERLDPSLQDLYSTTDGCIYKKASAPSRIRTQPSGNGFQALSLESRCIEAAFNTTPVATICLDIDGSVASINQLARTTFGLTAQDIGKPLQDLELSYRPIELRSLIEMAYKEAREITVNRVVRHLPEQSEIFDLFIRPLLASGETIGVNIQFKNSTDTYNLQDEKTVLNHQLQTANEELQSAHEELETTNEELHSTNEELETTNEELQATNEELETMNEELQCTNTELEFSNHGQRELASTVEHVNAFFESILASIKSAVVVVDQSNKVQFWNDRCADLWGLRDDEVQGRDLFELDIGLPVAELKAPLAQLQDRDDKLADVSVNSLNRRGFTFPCRVRIMKLVDASGYILMIDEVK